MATNALPADVRPAKIAHTDTTRRALIGGAGLASLALVAPPLAIGHQTGSADFRSLMDANLAARQRFNALPTDLEVADAAEFQRETDRMIEACLAADQATPANWREFTELLDHLCEGGWNNIDGGDAERLLSHANRLLGKEA